MLVLKLAIDRIIGSLMRRVTNHWYEWSWRDPGAALRNELQRRATLAAADFVTTRMPDALYCGGKLDLLSYALKQAPTGLALEFGVFKGTTINHVARHFFQGQLAAETLRDARFAQWSSISIEQRNALHWRAQQRRRDRHQAKTEISRDQQHGQREKDQRSSRSQFHVRSS